MMNEYRYLCRMRPPGPGAVPRDGLMYADCSEKDVNGRHYWGVAAYSRKLSKEEAEHYDLEYMGGYK